MRYVRPYDIDALSPGGVTPWIIGPEDGAGCVVRGRRGGGDSAADRVTPDAERLALVLSGEARLETLGATKLARAGDALLIPAGVEGEIVGDASTTWLDITAPVSEPALRQDAAVFSLDPSRFEGEGFAYQRLAERAAGATTMAMNLIQVQPGSGSPDFHIHHFAQIYLIQEGEMTIDIGRRRLRAGPSTVVFLPEGVVHRNFNAADGIERHVSLLAPEPREGEIFDYAVTISEREAELLTKPPAALGGERAALG